MNRRLQQWGARPSRSLWPASRWLAWTRCQPMLCSARRRAERARRPRSPSRAGETPALPEQSGRHARAPRAERATRPRAQPPCAGTTLGFIFAMRSQERHFASPDLASRNAGTLERRIHPAEPFRCHALPDEPGAPRTRAGSASPCVTTLLPSRLQLCAL
jgi:hypothetical protein